MEIKNIKFKSKNELIKICKNKNIKGYSKLNKDELIQYIKTYNKKGSGKNIWGPRSWWISFKHKYYSNSKKYFRTYAELRHIINIYYKIKYEDHNFNDDLNFIRNKYGKIDNWDVSRIKDMNNLFNGLNLFNENLSKWDVSNVTNMENMFNGCGDFKGDISSWDVSNVNNMKNMFNGCLNFEGDISSWDVSNVTNMSNMFYNCNRFISNISSWDVSNVTDMSNMFYNCSRFNSNISSWNVGNVTNMSNMFYNCYRFNTNISSWDVSKVTNMNNMFNTCYNFNIDVSSWNVSNVTDMSNMFCSCYKFNSNISSWNVGKVTDMKSMFKDCKVFNQDLSKWDVKNVTNMSRMFINCKEFNQPLDNWNVSNVITMAEMFSNCKKFNGNMSSWNTYNVTDMNKMFSDCSKFNRNLSTWNVSNVKDMESMFRSCKEFNQPLDSWNVSNVTNMLEMFSNCENFDKPLNNWKVHNVEIMRDMFDKCTEFNQPLGRWNVSKVKTTAGMFCDCEKFNQPLDSWKVTSVNYMEFMFYNCIKFNQPLNSWNVSNVTNMSNMFYNCIKFNQPLNSWVVSKVENFREMFYNCKEFNQNLNSWDVSNVDIRNFREMFHKAMKMEPDNVREWGIEITPLFDIGRVNINQEPNQNGIIRGRVNIISSNIISFNQSMLSSNNNNCNTKLYDMLLKSNSSELKNKKFTFENERGIDLGGLSRTVYDIFFRTYLNKFFKSNDDHFYILRNSKNLDELKQATNILIILSEKAKINIVLPINPELIDFVKLNDENVKNNNKLINLDHEKNKYVKRNGFNLSTKNGLQGIGLNNLSNVMAENENKKYNFETNQRKWSNNDKKEIYLRIYIKKFGFESKRQFLNMKSFMHDFILNKQYKFKNEISFSKEDFFKRIKIIKPRQRSNQAINIPKNINTNSFVKKHPNLKLLLNYIDQEDDKYREDFNIWITGSKYSNAELKLWVYKGTFVTPYKVSTCFNSVNIYKTDKINNMNNTKMLQNLKKTIQNNINKSKFTTE